LKIGDERRVSMFTKNFLKRIALSSGIKALVITSTTRSAAEQAEAMYKKVARGKYDRYAQAGRSVQTVAKAGIARREKPRVVIDRMIVEIEKVGFHNVSQYAGVIGLNVVDVAPSPMSLVQRTLFCKAVRNSFGSPVYKCGHPNGPERPRDRYEFRDHDCFHLAIMQPEELETLHKTA
jgi:hypothetical protein